MGRRVHRPVLVPPACRGSPLPRDQAVGPGRRHPHAALDRRGQGAWRARRHRDRQQCVRACQLLQPGDSARAVAHAGHLQPRPGSGARHGPRRYPGVPPLAPRRHSAGQGCRLRRGLRLLRTRHRHADGFSLPAPQPPDGRIRRLIGEPRAAPARAARRRGGGCGRQRRHRPQVRHRRAPGRGTASPGRTRAARWSRCSPTCPTSGTST